MESNSYLISPDCQYRQELRLTMSESEIRAMHWFLARMELDHPETPKVVKDLRCELWYMLTEVKEFNAYLEQGGRP